MMNERKKWIKALDLLKERNFRVSQFYRRATNTIADKVLKAALIRLSSKRAQFAYEIDQQIQKLGGSILSPQREDLRTSAIFLNLTKESTEIVFVKSIKAEKESIKDYGHALAAINHGSTREILIRHKAEINRIIKELQKLQALPRDSRKKNIKTN